MILASLLLAAATSSGVDSLATVPGLSVSVEHAPPALVGPNKATAVQHLISLD